ncbi:MAG: LysM peptidoglycan-binding domain-containing protein [Gammaproteobacteria bacterium]|nr:LysM peptidoglycan-binding domain-containing protein [Gammaproteobacteria bacterium]MDH4315885.1 LysM peptidoglycan-binding domain-containing protein [Gammaproteobacteria bacterium]
MSRRLNRIWLLPALLLVSEAWALGLGDIRLSSALNEPLKAEIELLSASPDELTNITVQLASADTFERYGIDRPLFLTRIQFTVVRSGRADGNYINIRSIDPIREPFVTFLVEASWSRGRLLREYTLLLDPPTFALPPVAETTESVTAPTRAAQTDSGRIERPAAPSTPEPQSESAPTPPPRTAPRPTTESDADPRSFDTTAGGDLVVQRGDTLWGIAQRVRPDNRLTMNQTMLAIFEANPQAFVGNINRLSAGASLRIPSADDIFRISRNDAQNEVMRQNQSWGGSPGVTTTQPSLTLVPPDDDQTAYDGTQAPGTDIEDSSDYSSGDPTEDRIREIERMLADQDSLIEIESNELAALRAELARLRGEEPPVIEPELVDDTVDDQVTDDGDEIFAADDDAAADDGAVTDDELVTDDAADAADSAVDATQPEVPRVVRRLDDQPGLVDKILGFVTGIWGWIGGALIVVIGILVWFARRAASRGDDDSTGVWDALDADDLDSESVASTERLRALAREDDTAIVVVEQGGRGGARDEFMVEAPEDADDVFEKPARAAPAESMEDTFSSETAINLDQSDPVAEADFHMAYGLYDQAADLINGALTLEPDRQDLLAKLCEIYYVWGNRDAFIDAASRTKAVLGADDAEWGKIVIMGQQIAGDHELFSGVSAGAATRAVDLSFEGGMDEAGELDMDFAGGPDGAASDVIDLGAEDDDGPSTGDQTGGLDFSFDEDDTSASVTREMPKSGGDDSTAESPTLEMPESESTVETPTIEQQFADLEATGEIPSLADDEATTMASLDDDEHGSDGTAEINLDDLDLDLAGLDDEVIAYDDEIDLSDLDDTSESQTLNFDDLDATGKNYALDDADDSEATGKNPELSATGLHTALGDDDDQDDTDVGVEVDTSLLDATGMTQVLSDDMAVETANDIESSLSDDDKTMLAPMDDDSDFDFAKTEALPKDVFTGNSMLDDTGELPGLAAGSTDVDLDLDDLTAALKVSGMGDTVSQQRDDRTVEQPKIKKRSVDLDVGADDDDTSPTQALSPEDISDDLHDARTMTEVGTKLDLARAYVDMGDPAGARSILEEVLDEGDVAQRQQAQKLLDSLPS